MKNVICEIVTYIPPTYPELLKQAWGEAINDPAECLKQAEKLGLSQIAVRFNDEDIERSMAIFKEIETATASDLIITGTFRRDLDLDLLPWIAENASRKHTIGVVEEETYKKIAPVILENGHNVIAKTPIDINLAKQLNILLSEMGFSHDRIIMDPDTSALGYGLDYAYSVIERIKIAGRGGDVMLNLPILTFVGEECWKTKEAKSTQAPEEWGDINTRAIAWEAITASSMFVAGADMVVMRHPEAIRYIDKFAQKVTLPV